VERKNLVASGRLGPLDPTAAVSHSHTAHVIREEYGCLAQIGIPGSGGRGDLLGGALEMSNVDLAREFTSLIVAQRGFQANSRVITSSDEMLQDLVNIKH